MNVPKLNTKGLLQSKRFWASVVYVIVTVIVVWFPEFQSAESELITGLTALFSLLIFGYTVTDLATVISAAKAIAAITPTTRDDQVISAAEGLLQGAGILPTAK